MTVTAVAPTEVGVEVGTVFRRSWGYDQTNVDYYRVVALTPKGVKIQKWQAVEVSDDGHGNTRVTVGDAPATHTVWPKVEQADLDACDRCRTHTAAQFWPGSIVYAAYDCPTHGSRTEDCPIETKRLSSYGGDSVYVAVGHYHDHAYRWDGGTDHATATGWGH